jgi:hypothetical protein
MSIWKDGRSKSGEPSFSKRGGYRFPAVPRQPFDPTLMPATGQGHPASPQQASSGTPSQPVDIRESWLDSY